MLAEGQLPPGFAFQAGVEHTAAGVIGAVGVVVIPVEQRRNIDTQLVIADPANIVEQVVIGGKTEAGAAVETVTFVRALIAIAGHIVELRADAAANGKVKTAQRIAGLRVLLQQCDLSLGSERSTANDQSQSNSLS
ncbi:hypothetical protein D3C71_1160610 [compost metagenome]